MCNLLRASLGGCFEDGQGKITGKSRMWLALASGPRQSGEKASGYLLFPAERYVDSPYY